MTDDLAKRLRGPQSAEVDYATRQEGADRIEALTAERDKLRIALTDAERYLKKGLDKMAYNIIRAELEPKP